MSPILPLCATLLQWCSSPRLYRPASPGFRLCFVFRLRCSERTRRHTYLIPAPSPKEGLRRLTPQEFLSVPRPSPATDKIENECPVSRMEIPPRTCPVRRRSRSPGMHLMKALAHRTSFELTPTPRRKRESEKVYTTRDQVRGARRALRCVWGKRGKYESL